MVNLKILRKTLTGNESLWKPDMTKSTGSDYAQMRSTSSLQTKQHLLTHVLT